MSALDTQVGASHYKDYPIQPVEFCMKNKLDYCQSNVIKYVVRFRDKGGKQDLKKAIHYIELLWEMEYGQRESNDVTTPNCGFEHAYSEKNIPPCNTNKADYTAYDSQGGNG